ncbi:glutamate ABC transporter substrate-binding protein [Streptomyces litchfieldiae]|uniref:Glutamate ABC transporter substrate-binding protein n=1 Tax=Streptomyces litchfieldiae TaxID=3075543 RepID=A0ABU2MMH0_9ACTN|nr:glutamate ABC transporter substrate-binding protein [Streptomyces sp. DSM 44938]MDT0342799.1 glutamate ABC transporter substrate-binding protein [Streptomyces sp. DSM 44938]
MSEQPEQPERTARRDRIRPTRRGTRADRRALLLAAAGLALAGTMLVGSLPRNAGGEAARTGPGYAVAEPADDHIAPLAERERCDDGTDAAASFRPERDETGRAIREIQERGHLVVGIDQNSYLWGYRTPDTGDIVGFDIELVRAIADDLLGDPDAVTFLAIPTSERANAIRGNDVDMVVRTMSITCERWEKVAFSTAYFETGQQLLVPRDSPIEGYDDSLRGMRVCSAEGSTAEGLLQDNSFGAELVLAPNHLDCLVQVQLGVADALMTDSALAAGHIAQDPSTRLVGEPLTQESYGVAMNLDNTDLVRWVNAVLEDYRGGGAQSGWREAAEDWLAGYLYPEGDPPPEPPRPLYRD